MDALFANCFGVVDPEVDKYNYIFIISNPSAECESLKMIKLFDDIVAANGVILLHPDLSPRDTKHIKCNYNLEASVKYPSDAIANDISSLDNSNFKITSNILCIYKNSIFLESHYVDSDCDSLYNSIGK
jgi:hypothetical protein